MVKIKDLYLIDKEILDFYIDKGIVNNPWVWEDDDYLKEHYPAQYMLKRILNSASPAKDIIEQAYEAGTLDRELSLSFDNPKGRFMNTEIEL